MSPSISVENIVDKSIRLLVVQENIKKSMSICWGTFRESMGHIHLFIYLFILIFFI